MHYWRFMMMAGLLTACTGEKPVDDTTGDDDDDTVGDDDDDTVGDDDDDTVGDTGTTVPDDSGTIPVDYIDPVAVGFEYDGVLTEDGTLSAYTVPGYGDYYPAMFLYFAGIDYFSGNADDICLAIVAPFDPVPGPALDTHDGADLFWSYDTTLGPITDVDCADKADPAIWGADAADLLGPFDGAHFGYGFGVITDYLIEAFGTTTPLDPEVRNALMGGYIAINDAAGDWIAYDWTITYAFEWDSATGEVALDGSSLVFADVSGYSPPSTPPGLYIRSAAFWYQDFIYMDFDNLAD